MLTYIITASINEIENLKPLQNREKGEVKVIIIDEGNKKVRLKNDKHLKGVLHEHCVRVASVIMSCLNRNY